jgi:hypothetical protein
MKDFVLLLQDIFECTFQILPPLGNLPNILFSLVLFGGTVYWLKESANYSKKAKQEGTYE